MDTNLAVTSATQPAMTLSELAAHLSVSTQALCGLRSKGRGPRGFRVGRQLRFRMSEIEAWLARMMAADGERHARRNDHAGSLTPHGARRSLAMKGDTASGAGHRLRRRNGGAS